MKKIIALAAVFLMVAGMGAAVDRHAPIKTGLFEVTIDDVEVAGWQSVTIPGKSVEQGEYREGNDAKHEKKLWGQVSFDDLEMERGVKPGALLIWDTDEGDAGKHLSAIVIDWNEGLDEEAIIVTPGDGENTIDIEVEEPNPSDVRAGSADSARKEISVKMQDEEQEARVETENGKDVNIIQEKKGLAGDGDDEFGNPVPVTLEWATSEGDAGKHLSAIVIETGGSEEIIVTFDGDGEEAVSVSVGDTETGLGLASITDVDCGGPDGGCASVFAPLAERPEPTDAKDVRAGKADSARKEIAVKVETEEGKEVNVVQRKKILAIPDDDEGYGLGDEVSAWVKEYSPPELDSSADGDMAARDGGHFGREPEEKEVEMIPARDGDGENPCPCVKVRYPWLAIGSDSSDNSASAELADLDDDGDVDAFVVNTGADGDMATESVTIAFDEMIRTEG